ncbi:MAG: hypothetical protein Q7R65_03155 [bacterium]|nr:hypothetical protein [bacterium]
MEKTTRTTIIYGIIALIIIIGSLLYANRASGGPGKLDGFAQCLKDKGAIFYGAFWCQHCQNQKALFGNSKKYLPYIECSTPNGQGQTEICKEKGIQGYPTWVFADMSSTTGEVALSTLSEKTGCPLPN